MLKLNLGSGDVRLDGFTNVDLYDKTADVKADICELPFEDDSVDEILACQVIEHIPYNKSEQVLSEMYRVLKPHRKAIIETPDIDYVCMMILEEGITQTWINNLVGEYYRPWDKDRYDDWEMNAASIHRNPWNFKRLEEIAKKAGFSQIVRLEEDKIYDYPENMRVRLVK